MGSLLKNLLLGAVFLGLACSSSGFAAKKRRKRSNLKPITHPVILWSRTLAESEDADQKRVAAFKLSQYSQPIYQEQVILTLISCLKESDVQIKILCAKALGNAGSQSKKTTIRTALMDAFRADPSLRETLVRTFIARDEDSKEVQSLLLEALNKAEDSHEIMALLAYFYECGKSVGPEPFMVVFNKSTDERIRRRAIKVLAERGNGESSVVDLLASCAESQDTPLALTCLSGLQLQTRKDSSRIWSALEKTIESSDPDMLIATLDVLNVLPERINSPMTKRLIEIISETEDAELVDKAVLGLGVCGDQSQSIVASLEKILHSKEAPESSKIHAALVLGKQASLFPETPKQTLSQCAKSSPSQSLKTACQLGSQELGSRMKSNGRIPASPEASGLPSKPNS